MSTDPKSLAAEIEAKAVKAQSGLARVYELIADQYGTWSPEAGTQFTDRGAAEAVEGIRLARELLAEIAALQSRAFEDGARTALVPLEPTEAMLNAPLAPGSSITGARYESRCDLRPLIYAAMIAARPGAPTENARDKALRDIAQQDRGGLQGVYEDGGDADAAINYLLGQIERRRKIARAALAEQEKGDA